MTTSYTDYIATERSKRDQRRAEHEKARNGFIERLGLEFHGYVSGIEHGSLVTRYHWPKEKTGTRFDKTVYLIVHNDGSWSAAIDDGWHKISDTEAALRVMAKASEQITPS